MLRTETSSNIYENDGSSGLEYSLGSIKSNTKRKKKELRPEVLQQLYECGNRKKRTRMKKGEIYPKLMTAEQVKLVDEVVEDMKSVGCARDHPKCLVTQLMDANSSCTSEQKSLQRLTVELGTVVRNAKLN